MSPASHCFTVSATLAAATPPALRLGTVRSSSRARVGGAHQDYLIWMSSNRIAPAFQLVEQPDGLGY